MGRGGKKGEGRKGNGRGREGYVGEGSGGEGREGREDREGEGKGVGRANVSPHFLKHGYASGPVQPKYSNSVADK
jgi:hypothetical protein